MEIQKTLTVATLSFVTVLAQAQAHKIKQDHPETRFNYTHTILHGPIPNDDSHLIDHGTKWRTWGGLFEIAGVLTDDTIAFGISNEHIDPPHDEGEGLIITWADVFLPGEYPDSKYVALTGDVSADAHGAHFDIFAIKTILKLGHFLGIDDIGGYGIVLTGQHTDNADACVSIDTQSLVDSINEFNKEETWGDVSMSMDTRTGVCSLAGVLGDMPISDLEQVALHLGGPEDDGPMILDLGGPSEWTDVDGYGVMRTIADVSFPQQYLPALMSGQVYALVRTKMHPNGAARGQLAVKPWGTAPRSLQVPRGRIVSGGLAELASNDDAHLKVLRTYSAGQIDDPVQIDMTGWTPEENPSKLRVHVEAKTSMANLTQTTALLDVATQQFVPIDVRPATTTDSRFDVDVVQQPGRFVATDGTVRAKLSFRSAGSAASSLWTASVDKFRWQVFRP